MPEQERDETLQRLCYNLELKVARFMRHEAGIDALNVERNAIHARVAELVAQAREEGGRQCPEIKS